MIKITILIFGLTSTLLAHDQVGLDENIRKRSEALASGLEVFVMKEKFHCIKILPEFYNQRLFKPAWTDKNSNAFFSILAQANEEGLDSEDYHYSTLNFFLNKTKNAEE